MDDTAPTQAAMARNFALRLTLDTPLGLSPELGRLAAGLSISAFYGLALGARTGGTGLLANALGCTVGIGADVDTAAVTDADDGCHASPPSALTSTSIAWTSITRPNSAAAARRSSSYSERSAALA